MPLLQITFFKISQVKISHPAPIDLVLLSTQICKWHLSYCHRRVLASSYYRLPVFTFCCCRCRVLASCCRRRPVFASCCCRRRRVLVFLLLSSRRLPVMHHARRLHFTSLFMSFTCFLPSVMSCLYVFMSLCLHVFMSSCLHVFMSSSLQVFKSSSLYVFMSSCLHVFMSCCLHVLLSSCLLVFMSSLFCIISCH